MALTLPDARLLSDEVLEASRLRAVHGCELGYYTEAEVADLLGVARETVFRWVSVYHAGGPDALPHERSGRPVGSGRSLSDGQAARPSGADRRSIKGQRYTLLSHGDNLSLAGRKALHLLFVTNQRFKKANILQGAFDQLWEYRSPGWARRFFDNWRAALRRQRLKPFQKFAHRSRRTGTPSRRTAWRKTRSPGGSCTCTR